MHHVILHPDIWWFAWSMAAVAVGPMCGGHWLVPYRSGGPNAGRIERAFMVFSGAFLTLLGIAGIWTCFVLR